MKRYLEMKKMICEVCNGSDFLKEDGVFVCQTCGMKYSLDEAKKLVKDVSDSEEITETIKSVSSEAIAKARHVFEQETLPKLFWTNTTELIENYDNKTIFSIWKRELADTPNPYNVNDFSISIKEIKYGYSLIIIKLPIPVVDGQLYSAVGIYNSFNNPQNYAYVVKQGENKAIYLSEGLIRFNAPFAKCHYDEDEIILIENQFYKSTDFNESVEGTNSNFSNDLKSNLKAYDFINSFTPEEIITIAKNTPFIFPKDIELAETESKKIRSGKTGFLSIAQIAWIIISFTPGVKNLTEDEFFDIITMFCFFQKFTEKTEYNSLSLFPLMMILIQHLNALAPYGKYSNKSQESVEEMFKEFGINESDNEWLSPKKGFTKNYHDELLNSQNGAMFRGYSKYRTQSQLSTVNEKPKSFKILGLIVFIAFVFTVIISLQGLGKSENNEIDNSNFGPNETVKSEENDNNYSNESQNKTVSIMIGTMHLQIPDGFRHIETDSDYLNYYYNEDHDQAIYYDVFQGSIDDIDESVFEQYCENEDGCPYDELTRSTLNQHYIVYTFMNDPSDGYTNAIYYVQLNSTDIAQVLFRYSDSDELNAKGIMNKARFN